MSNMISNEEIVQQFRELQLFICNELERVDGHAQFSEDKWERQEGGGGFTRTIKEGDLIEKGGVAFSSVHGPVSEIMRNQLKLEGEVFSATGVSIVLHPKNPHVPIIHMNVRYFELDNGKTYWFGGGIDLTPHYVIKEHATLFHQDLKTICDQYNSDFYDQFKPWADKYFFIPHRNESRGIGGIFFDHLNQTNSSISKNEIFQFCEDLGKNFPYIYEKQASFGRLKSFTEQELLWRNIRRGRYVEFNLVHDKGTKFGLLSGGRTESILMSLPNEAQWEYCFDIKSGSKEEETLQILSSETKWIN